MSRTLRKVLLASLNSTNFNLAHGLIITSAGLLVRRLCSTTAGQRANDFNTCHVLRADRPCCETLFEFLSIHASTECKSSVS